MTEFQTRSSRINRHVVCLLRLLGCGELADRIARQLACERRGADVLLAGIGGVLRVWLQSENAEHILVVDGCPLNCAANTLKLAGFEKFDHLELHKIGIAKLEPGHGERISSACGSEENSCGCAATTRN